MNNSEYRIVENCLVPWVVFNESRCLKTGRMLKGHSPWNKGKTGYMGANKTSFKPGDEPKNTKYDGCISYRYHKRDSRIYAYIRITKRKWELLQRHIWKEKYGSIPKGYVIRLKDGNSDNMKLSNLECVSRAENMHRNRNNKKKAETMKMLWKAEKLRAKYDLPRKTKLRIK